jgi:cardiolipin synthase A/B
VSIEGPDRLSALRDALEHGEIQLSSPTASLQSSLGIPERRLRLYRDALRAAPDTAALILALTTACETARTIEAQQPRIEVAWTYPGDARGSLRTTGGVARDIIDASRNTLLIVGYSVTTNPAFVGLAAQTLAHVARAGSRGVAVTAVMDRNVNKVSLLRAWNPAIPLPSLFTWPEAGDKMAALHAKLLIADRKDALITSANLTYHGFERNLEMGVRVTGKAAGEIHDQIQELITARELVPWTD